MRLLPKFIRLPKKMRKRLSFISAPKRVPAHVLAELLKKNNRKVETTHRIRPDYSWEILNDELITARAHVVSGHSVSTSKVVAQYDLNGNRISKIK